MAKHPVPGQVKTRLARVLGPDRACELYRAFILDLADRLRRLPYRVTWAYTPATAPFSRLVRGVRCRPQRGRDLGARMAHAIAGEVTSRRDPVLVIGADAPHVPAASLAEATTMLRRSADVVVGPAADGGYYLIGVRAPAPSLFRRIPWGTDAVLGATLERAGASGLGVHLLPWTFDVDEADDLERLRALLVRGDVQLPRTALLLAGRRAASRA